MRVKISSSTLFLILLIVFGAFSQGIIITKNYPQNYFRYPLNLPPSTAGSFAELRPNHFHSGLDFKTNHQKGFPVYAVNDGYVSRLRVQFGGFGNAIYITHPNGYTTVYGHIEKFGAAMDKYVKDAQAQQQSFEVDVNLEPNQIPICKDDIIALSGNAGASAGPHLHFEIRDSQTQETINPQLFGLTIPDTKPPSITAIGVYAMNEKPFSENTPRVFLPVKAKAGKYYLKKPITLHLNGIFGFGISTNDLNNLSENHNGVYSIELKLDDKTVYTFAAERFAFDQTHAINAYIDYPAFLKNHRWMQKCFILPGSNISLYPNSINRGLISFDDNKLHKVEYMVKDIAGNTSTLLVNVQAGGALKHSITNNQTSIKFKYNQKNEFVNQDVRMIIPPGNLYDDLDFNYRVLPKRPGAYSVTHCIHNFYTPIHDGFDLWIKPDNSIGKYGDKAVIVNSAGVCDGGIYQDGFVKATAHSFGDYFIKIDTIPPLILPLNKKKGGNLSHAVGIFVRISDNLSGIKSYNAKIDGSWVLMEWDFKTRILSYIFNKDFTKGNHQFELTVTDKKNNSSVYKTNFFR